MSVSIPANLTLVDVINRKIIDVTFYDSANNAMNGPCYWITDNAFAFDYSTYWAMGWYVAYFNSNGTYQYAEFQQSGIPTLQKILDSVNGNPYYNWYGNLQNSSVIIPNPNSNPYSNTCFPAGTPVNTNQGIIPIELLDPNVHTIRNKKIIGVSKTVSLDKFLVCFEKDALGSNVPSQKTIISNNHGIYYEGEMIRADKFIDKFKNVNKIRYTGEVLYNVLMEKHDKMVINNLICETLDPESYTVKLYKILQTLSPEEQQKRIKNYNDFIIKNNIFAPKK